MKAVSEPLRADKKKLYEIFQARDERFDGRFFVGVSSTGIYCRPVCRARMPKEENCAFFSTAAEAEAAGYRPCMICRPELAPTASAAVASSALAARAARLMEEDSSGTSIEMIAKKLGCTDRHLRRVFTETFHIPPVQYLQTCRLLLAKSLLTDTDLPIIDVAMAAGFGSLRQFNHVFQLHYKMSPTALRKEAGKKKRSGPHISVLLGYHAPYRFDDLLRFFQLRAIPGVESVKENTYQRTVRLYNTKGAAVTGWIQVSHQPDKKALRVAVSDSLVPVLSQVLSRVRQLFDLYCQPEIIRPVLQDMNAYKPELYQHGVRLPGCFEPFEMAVRAVLGQQISVKAACTLAGRIAETYGAKIETGIPGLDRVFPSPEELLTRPETMGDKLGKLGVIASRSQTIESLAKTFIKEEIIFDINADPETEMKKLLEIKGIGSWTAQYIAMRTMAWTDAFPESDLGIRKAMPGTSKERMAMAQRWRPWRSYATVCLWNAMEHESDAREGRC